MPGLIGLFTGVGKKDVQARLKQFQLFIRLHFISKYTKKIWLQLTVLATQ